ncbi:MAG TPA: hypothetical protein VFK94_05970, partial [Patescibacteria group bacterium]|nr:hypothetical protein [Patescibacteria group bacterium]
MAKNKGAEIKPKVTFDMLFDKYSKQKAVPGDRPLRKRMRSPPRQERPMTPPRDTQRLRSEMWVPPTNPAPVWDDNGVMWVPYQSMSQPYFRHALDRISRPVHDRLTFNRPGQDSRPQAVRPPVAGGQTGWPRAVGSSSSRRLWQPKKKEEVVQKMDIDSERTTGLDVIQIGTMNISLEDKAEGPILIEESVKKPTPVISAANDHETNSNKSQFFLPKWCPPGLTRTQRRKLQRLRCQEKKEKEAEQQRDEYFNKHRPMIPQKQEWRVKMSDRTEVPEQAVQPGVTGGPT